ncbi:tyrosine-type recombinase/integrase [Anaerotignum sp.]|uniref:tyrosine-type recombinase/integrase n=1 Tax=Anaerotignum sp. TaxID=2039241 RepID=UPI002714F67B|nr:site-specific integrase [Anaerotignum sp.]
MKKICLSNPDKVITVRECFENYIIKCTVRNLSASTIVCYKDHYRIFEQYIGGQQQLISNINEETINGFILYLRTRCSDITINSYLRSIRAFLNYASENEYIKPFLIPFIKADKKIKETYSDEELKVLLKKPNIKTCNFTEYKTWVFSNYLLATGNRISSALNVRIRDLDFDNSLIQINKSKNRKAQIIPLSSSLVSILKEYLSYRKGSDEDYVFCNTYGDIADIRTYQEMLARYNKKRGVTKTSAHLYRHTFAKKWILNGGDIFRLQKLLGHSDLTVVKEYVNLFSKDLSTGFDQFNPLDSLGLYNNNKKIKFN